MKKKITALLVGIIMVTSLVLTGCNGGDKALSKEDSVAIVNDGMVSKEDFDAYISFQKKGAEASGQVTADMWGEDSGRGKSLEDELKEGTLDFMITQEIVLQNAKKEGIVADEKSIEEELSKIKQGFETEEKYNEYLTTMGIDNNYIKKLISDRMIISEYLDKAIVVSDEEIKAYYDENKAYIDAIRASHILIAPEQDEEGKVSESADVKAKAKAEEILVKVKAGENFEELAKENSTCSSAMQGGDLGFFGKGQMVQEFNDVAFGLELGKVSDVVKTEFGYHIIKLTDKKMDLESNREEIEDALKGEQFNAKVEELKESAKIEKLLVFEAKANDTNTTNAGIND